ncbi:MAG: hypothetical protein GF381_00005 [Candidatus Pacebacteria bacterium]|nr:hypothetical protein [Candidatus Paceibacterota bacterium]
MPHHTYLTSSSIVYQVLLSSIAIKYGYQAQLSNTTIKYRPHQTIPPSNTAKQYRQTPPSIAYQV